MGKKRVPPPPALEPEVVHAPAHRRKPPRGSNQIKQRIDSIKRTLAMSARLQKLMPWFKEDEKRIAKLKAELESYGAHP